MRSLTKQENSRSDCYPGKQDMRSLTKQENSKRRILIIDDNPANLRRLVELLSEHDYVVHPTTTGKLDFHFIQSILPDLILLDIMMPDMNGFQVCQALKANERTR